MARPRGGEDGRMTQPADLVGMHMARPRASVGEEEKPNLMVLHP